MKQTICGLQNAKDEIDEALNILWLVHSLPFAQVWIPYEDENQVAFSSSSRDTGSTKRMLWLKLTGHSCDILDDGDFVCLEDYGTACYRLPLKMDEGLSGKTLQNYEPHFNQNILKLNDNNPQRSLLYIKFPCSCFVVYLRSTKTGDLDYVFQFLWNKGNDILLETLLVILKKSLPSFKFASGTELGNEIDILDVENSIGSENKYIMIFQTNNISLKRGSQSKVEGCLMPSKAKKGKTMPIILSREQIESQFGQTLEEAAPKLNVSVSTLKRKCKNKDVKWRGKDYLEKNQSDTNEEEDKGGAVHDPLANIREMCLDENILTIKAEYAGDLIKFTLPISSATFEAIQKKIIKRFNVGPAANYKLKYLDDEDNLWILFACDDDVKLCTENKRNIRLLLLPRHPSRTYQLN